MRLDDPDDSLLHVRKSRTQSEQGKEDETNSQDSKQSEIPIRINICQTQYDIVKEVAQYLNFTVVDNTNAKKWDVFWQDQRPIKNQIKKLKPYQKINHFPGMECLTRKDLLFKNLQKMKSRFNDSYDFFPQTWIIPQERDQLEKALYAVDNFTLIVKPVASSQGRGIYLAQSMLDIPKYDETVAQKYIERPLLIDNLKFDLRIYVLITQVKTLEIYMYKEGLARFSTEKYEQPSKYNLKNQYLHLTNYSVNKKNTNFQINSNTNQPDQGHKRSLQSVFSYMQRNGINISQLVKKIKDIIVKTIVAVQPQLESHYTTQRPNEKFNVCFQILGIDILIDQDLKPWLLEINQSPSFKADSPLDRQIKFNLIKDTFELMRITPKNREKIKIEHENHVKRQQNFWKSPLIYTDDLNCMRISNPLIDEQQKNERMQIEKRFKGNYHNILKNYNQSLLNDYLQYSYELFQISSKQNRYVDLVSLSSSIQNFKQNSNLNYIEQKMQKIENDQNLSKASQNLLNDLSTQFSMIKSQDHVSMKKNWQKKRKKSQNNQSLPKNALSHNNLILNELQNQSCQKYRMKLQKYLKEKNLTSSQSFLNLNHQLNIKQQDAHQQSAQLSTKIENSQLRQQILKHQARLREHKKMFKQTYKTQINYIQPQQQKMNYYIQDIQVNQLQPRRLDNIYCLN